MEPKIHKVDPLPPTRLTPSRKAEQRLRTSTPPIEMSIELWKKKTILRSRTIVTVIVSVLGFILVQFLGVDVDLGTFVESADGLQLGELILMLGGVIAAYFRKNARADLSGNENG